MPVEKFIRLVSGCVPLPEENVDTDQIIPARFLKATTRDGFGENLFYDWRYLNGGTANPDFVLNNPAYSGAVLVAGKNFGSGSSREHAAWAIYDYGFRVVISGSFADIFKNNALNVGLLPVQADESFVEALFEQLEIQPATQIAVDLESQHVSILPGGPVTHFEIDAYKKNCLLRGFDDVDYLLSRQTDIEAFEHGRNVYYE